MLVTNINCLQQPPQTYEIGIAESVIKPKMNPKWSMGNKNIYVGVHKAPKPFPKPKRITETYANVVSFIAAKTDCTLSRDQRTILSI